MKIKTNTYGVCYKDNGEWRGPYETHTLQNKKEKKAVKKAASARLKKRIKLLKATWAS